VWSAIRIGEGIPYVPQFPIQVFLSLVVQQCVNSQSRHPSPRYSKVARMYGKAFTCVARGRVGLEGRWSSWRSQHEVFTVAGKSSGLEGYLRICKNKCHPLSRYSYPGEGAIVERSIANYIIIEGGGRKDRQNLQINWREERA
jgi:hypothetical protein